MAQSACALHCNVCDYPGWAGTITMTTHITGAPMGDGVDHGAKTYQENATQTYFVGGPSQPSGSQTLYPTGWDLTRSGQFVQVTHLPMTMPETTSAMWHTSASLLGSTSSPLDCGTHVCFAEEITDPATGTVAFLHSIAPF
jgi:hypothetical protein